VVGSGQEEEEEGRKDDKEATAVKDGAGGSKGRRK